MTGMDKHRVVVLAFAVILAATAPRAEVVDDIVAWVNGDIITKSEYEEEAAGLKADAERSLTGEALDRELQQIRSGLLIQIIDRRVLLDRAKRFYDLSKMEEAFFDQFKEQQKKSDAEIEKLLAEDGTTVTELKRRLVQIYAPQEVVRLEIRDRLGVPSAEVRAYYDAHPEEFKIEAQATFREIVLLGEGAFRKRERRDEIEAMRVRLVAGESFEDMAKGVSEAPSNEGGGLVGPIRRSDVHEQLREVIFGIAPGAISEIVESPFGLHLIRVESREDDRSREFSDVEAAIRKRLEDRKWNQATKDFIDKARAEADWCVKPRYRDLMPDDQLGSCRAL